MKRFAFIFAIFFMYAIAFSPALFHSYCPLILQHIRLCMILDYVLAIASVCFIISLISLVLKAYKTALVFAIVPLFVDAVILCSALLIFMFHKELTAAMVRGKIKFIGEGIFNVLKAPFTIFKR